MPVTRNHQQQRARAEEPFILILTVPNRVVVEGDLAIPWRDRLEHRIQGLLLAAAIYTELRDAAKMSPQLTEATNVLFDLIAIKPTQTTITGVSP